jgi:hypothetical protein
MISIMSVACVHLVMDQQQQQLWNCQTLSAEQPQTMASGMVRQATWNVHHIKNHTLLDHSPPASQTGRRVGPIL